MARQLDLGLMDGAPALAKLELLPNPETDLRAAGRESDISRQIPAPTFQLLGPADRQELENKLPPALPFRTAIEETASRYELDSRLLAAIVEAESNFDPHVTSHRGAVGLTQILPQTDGRDEQMLRDPATNLDAGARYLRSLLDLYAGDLKLALAAYNAGPGRVERYGGIPPFVETRRYVEKVLELYASHQQGEWRTEVETL